MQSKTCNFQLSLFYQHNINENTRLGIWRIEEDENFFLQHVPLQREITHPHKRLQHLAGRFLLKQLFPDFPHREILIADTRKPYLPYEQYHFSISHCGTYAAAIVSKTERVGIDIEIPSAKIEKISHKFLNDPERNFLASLTDHSSAEVLTVMWSAKEAVYKWWGWGSVDFSNHILLQPFNDAEDINAFFLRAEEKFSLNLKYKIFEQLCLVWVASF